MSFAKALKLFKVIHIHHNNSANLPTYDPDVVEPSSPPIINFFGRNPLLAETPPLDNGSFCAVSDGKDTKAFFEVKFGCRVEISLLNLTVTHTTLTSL
jgi:hypothetical protein